MVRPRPRSALAGERRPAEEWESLTLWALNERIKELTCLYGISQLAAETELPLEEVLRGVVELLPRGWQYPAITEARIVLDGAHYVTQDFVEAPDHLASEIVISGKTRGLVEVVYLENRGELDEGPFLDEERHLLDAVARQIGSILERREAALERERLQEQLRHADRLATIGQLAAGVAHELNEPLGNILGFAQLAQKLDDLPEGVGHDLDRIVAASLHAREIVKKLMLFARQTPPATAKVDLNQIVELGLYFLEMRCARQKIDVVRSLAPHLPVLTADPAQLQQVLVNLVVNAIQAMPDGGTLTIATERAHDRVVLRVSDTGVGMTPEVREKVFLPFFTTKDVDQGTGLGLSVVHGIVAAHGGAISVESEPGRGSSFAVELPVGGRASIEDGEEHG